MDAWVVAEPGPIATGPLHRERREPPEPGPGEMRVRVSACGVCRTDLHVAEGAENLGAAPLGSPARPHAWGSTASAAQRTWRPRSRCTRA